jgi:hypothetical protein
VRGADRLLGAVRAGQSGALVTRGEQPQRDALAVAFGPSEAPEGYDGINLDFGVTWQGRDQD